LCSFVVTLFAANNVSRGKLSHWGRLFSSTCENVLIVQTHSLMFDSFAWRCFESFMSRHKSPRPQSYKWWNPSQIHICMFSSYIQIYYEDSNPLTALWDIKFLSCRWNQRHILLGPNAMDCLCCARPIKCARCSISAFVYKQMKLLS
jgi:hypothetical protein